jgi:hypothetical protein
MLPTAVAKTSQTKVWLFEALSALLVSEFHEWLAEINHKPLVTQQDDNTRSASRVIYRPIK